MTRPTVLLDPHPRRAGSIFDPEQMRRLQAMAEIVTEDIDGRLPAALVDAALPRVSAVLGQTDLPAERIAQAPHLKAVINVEGNFLPNVDATACSARGIEILSVAPVFAVPVAEMALGLALDLARGITAGDRAMREGREAYGRFGCAGSVLLSRATIGLVGFGNLGRALANYGGFATRGLRVACLVDADARRVGEIVGGLPVRHVEELDRLVMKHRVAIGVVATPPAAAQEVCDRLVAAGVRSILNFASAVVVVSDGVELRSVDLSTELQILAFHEQRRQSARAGGSIVPEQAASAETVMPA